MKNIKAVCKALTMAEINKIPNKDKFMSPFCGFQSSDETKVHQHNTKWHKDKAIHFVIEGDPI